MCRPMRACVRVCVCVYILVHESCTYNNGLIVIITVCLPGTLWCVQDVEYFSPIEAETTPLVSASNHFLNPSL